MVANSSGGRSQCTWHMQDFTNSLSLFGAGSVASVYDGYFFCRDLADESNKTEPSKADAKTLSGKTPQCKQRVQSWVLIPCRFITRDRNLSHHTFHISHVSFDTLLTQQTWDSLCKDSTRGRLNNNVTVHA